MRRMARLRAAIVVTLAIGSMPVNAQLRTTSPDDPGPPPGVHVKPADVALPPGAKPGEIRRIIQPFASWTLICDENLRTRTRICNVSQTLVDDAGLLVFSWSLAATRGGAPVFILRAPIAGRSDQTVTVGYGTKTPVTRVPLTTCDAALCIGLLPATTEIRRRIATGGAVRVAFMDHAGHSVVLNTTLDGLAAAIGSIK